MAKRRMPKSQAKVRGFFRIQIGEDGPDGRTRIVGDSGVLENQVTNLGINNYIISCLVGAAGSTQAAAMTLGSGTAPGSAATSLPSELSGGSYVRKAFSGTGISSSRTFTCTCTWASTEHPGGTPTISNAALINSTASAGTILCGNTFTGSSWATNQAVSATYTLSFA